MKRHSAEALAALGVDALTHALEEHDISVRGMEAGAGFDSILEVVVDDREVRLGVDFKAYCTGASARELIKRSGTPDPGITPIVVADKVTAEARDVLSDAGWSWLDRRGRLHLRAPAVRVDADVASGQTTEQIHANGAAIAGRGGIAVAYWLCSHPEAALSPTRDAATLGLAPSSVSTATQRLAAAGLVDEGGRGVFPELFFELASVWAAKWTWVATAPSASQRRGADPAEPTWRRTGTAAAAGYGAPVVAAEGGPVELYVPGPVEVSIALRRYGPAEPGTGAATLAVAPARAVVADPDAEGVVVVDGWPAAPLVAVALDLAQDRARGREVLEAWSRPDAIWR